VRVAVADLGVRLGGRVVLAGLSFDWEAPGIVAVTGPNGVGKTTLLKVLAGLLRPGRGEVRWEDAGRTLAAREARHRVGLAGPEIGLYEDLSALENLAFFARARGLVWNEAEGRERLRRVGLEGRADERVSAYSSGMKQRAKLAFAFQGRPTLVLLDEPGANLDAEGRARTAALVRDAAVEALVVVATNDEGEAAWAERRLELVPALPALPAVPAVAAAGGMAGVVAPVPAAPSAARGGRR
jgi:heme exporter protein A